MLLLKYFSAWGTYCEEVRFMRKNNILIEITNVSTSVKEREKAFSYMHGPLSTQRKMLQFQNIKLKKNPLIAGDHFV